MKSELRFTEPVLILMNALWGPPILLRKHLRPRSGSLGCEVVFLFKQRAPSEAPFLGAWAMCVDCCAFLSSSLPTVMLTVTGSGVRSQLSGCAGQPFFLVDGSTDSPVLHP